MPRCEILSERESNPFAACGQGEVWGDGDGVVCYHGDDGHVGVVWLRQYGSDDDGDEPDDPGLEGYGCG